MGDGLQATGYRNRSPLTAYRSLLASLGCDEERFAPRLLRILAIAASARSRVVKGPLRTLSQPPSWLTSAGKSSA